MSRRHVASRRIVHMLCGATIALAGCGDDFAANGAAAGAAPDFPDGTLDGLLASRRGDAAAGVDGGSTRPDVAADGRLWRWAEGEWPVSDAEPAGDASSDDGGVGEGDAEGLDPAGDALADSGQGAGDAESLDVDGDALSDDDAEGASSGGGPVGGGASSGAGSPGGGTGPGGGASSGTEDAGGSTSGGGRSSGGSSGGRSGTADAGSSSSAGSGGSSGGRAGTADAGTSSSGGSSGGSSSSSSGGASGSSGGSGGSSGGSSSGSGTPDAGAGSSSGGSGSSSGGASGGGAGATDAGTSSSGGSSGGSSGSSGGGTGTPDTGSGGSSGGSSGSSGGTSGSGGGSGGEPDAGGSSGGDDTLSGPTECSSHTDCTGEQLGPCATATCAKGVCVAAAAPQGTPCDDGNACTQGDVCSQGACVGPQVNPCDDQNPCTNDTCAPTTGCVHQANTAPCSDGKPCTVDDTCSQGACKGGPAKNCYDGNICTFDWCNTKNGDCVHNKKALHKKPCTDGSACTLADVCKDGTCKSGKKAKCSDGNPCTTDTCAAKSGCKHTPNTNPCSDGDACTTGDVCAGGQCTSGPKGCDDGNVCTVDTCTKGKCKHEPKKVPTACSPTTVCHKDHCHKGKCGDGVVSPALGEACDDGNKKKGDGCSDTCQLEDAACKDGKRDGLLGPAAFPKVAQCKAHWHGWIGGKEAKGKCGKGWHVCNAGDKAVLSTIPVALAKQPGCWAFNASNDKGTCSACPNNKTTAPMAGLGSGCKGSPVSSAPSCASPSWRVDAADRCVRDKKHHMDWLDGVLCCKG